MLLVFGMNWALIFVVLHLLTAHLTLHIQSVKCIFTKTNNKTVKIGRIVEVFNIIGVQLETFSDNFHKHLST